MGQNVTATYNTYYKSPDTAPDAKADPTYKHDYGFAAERKKRKAPLTQDQMEAALIDPDYRDYCAGHWVEFLKCRRDYFPWVVACNNFRHQWQQCEMEDYIMRMKEYEREKRLLERAKKKKLMAESERKEILVE